MKSKKIIKPFLLLFFTLFLSNQIHYDEVSLERLVDESDIILIVTKDSPEYITQAISILPEGSIFTGKNNPPYYEPPYHGAPDKPLPDKNYPPYLKIIYRFEVKEVLYQNDEIQEGDLGLRGKINITEADFQSKLNLHKMYYLEGARKSPIYESYKPSKNRDDLDEMIVFLQYRNEELTFTVINSYESVAMRRRVQRLIFKTKRGD